MSNISRNRRDFLVALLKNDDDFAILIQKGWYRIPLKTKRIPLEVKSNEVKYIGFYHNLQSKFYPAQIKYYGRVKNISVVRRKELFPEEIKNPKTENLYLKIEVQKLKELEEPIISRRRRRILFIMTTYEKFIIAEEINHLYKESSIEERMYEWMREADLEVERQFLLKINSRFFILDFALFCTKKNINIECDGDVFHTSPDDVMRDKKRDNLLQNHGWIVYRYHEKDINLEQKYVINQIKEAVNEYGGVARISFKSKKYLDAEGQSELF